MESEQSRYLTDLNQRIRRGCTAHLSPEGRIFYLNHETKISSWLPPVENWDSGGTGLPYGWEAALDKDGKTYYVNHVNKTTTYEDPRKEVEDEPPQPRDVELVRDPQMGFGFVAGSEKPVIVRFVTEGGPNEHKLLPGDQILKINGEDVMRAPREHVIELIRSCKHSVTLTVCQPHTNNTTRKSALLTAAKKAKLKSNPSRVRFAEGVVMNGSPLYSPSPLDSYVPFLPNVLKVFLENGQTKSFKYDSTTTVQDVLSSLHEKLSIKCPDHFSLVTEHVKIARRNRMLVLDPKETLAKIAARPGSHHLRCVYRVTFVPKDAYDLLQKDPVAFEYLYVQCCNDMVQERFAPELKYDIALRLAALHIQQHSLNSGMQGKITVKAIERECGLDRFVPLSLLETMKRKELRKLLNHFLKQNQSLCAPGQKQLTALQAKLHYLKIIGELPSYGSKCFSTNMKDSSPETALLVSPKFGLSLFSPPMTLAYIEELSDVRVSKEDELSYLVEVFLKDPDKQTLSFSMEDRDAEELVLFLKGYHRLLAGRDLPVQWDIVDPWRSETVPCFHNRHTVQEAPWSYPPHPSGPGLRTLDLTVPPPPYTSCDLPKSPSKEKLSGSPTAPASPEENRLNDADFPNDRRDIEGSIEFVVEQPMSTTIRLIPSRPIIDERHPGIDYQSVISMELLEDSSGDVDVDLFEARNDEVIKRISEMNQIVVDAETYLCYGSSEDGRRPSSAEPETPEHRPIKAADSLLLLTQAQQEEEKAHMDRLKAPILLDEEVSPSESDTDSTPNDSPLHRSTPIRNSLNSAHPRVRRDSSFGLHSPDLLPGLSSSTDNILEILKSLQAEEMPMPFGEGTLYLDPDLIDLTMIPPPNTPDKDTHDVSAHLSTPPNDFLDANSRHSELEQWIKLSQQLINEGESWSASGRNEADKSQSAHRSSVDSARVVADLDHLCDTLSEMRGRTASKLPSVKDPPSGKLSYKESIESFIASTAVPPPPLGGAAFDPAAQVDDLSAFIIPPPPSSSPSTEAQNEVIARFLAAAEDMKRMFGTPNEGPTAVDVLEDGDLTPTTDRCFKEDSWAGAFGEGQAKASAHFQRTLNLFDKFALDSELQSGDSSGYDTLTSSLTSYGENAMPEDVDSNTFNSVDEETHAFRSYPASSDTTPVVEQAPTSLPVCGQNNEQLPVQPHSKTSCIDATSPLSLTSPSSTTSSDSSVILADGCHGKSTDITEQSLVNGDAKEPVFHSGSYDNLPFKTGESQDSQGYGIARSVSWTSMSNKQSPVMQRKLIDDARLITPKPPIPPNPFQQSRLRKSFRRGSLKGNTVLRKSESPENNSPTDGGNGGTSTVRRGSRSPSPSRKLPLSERPLNGVTPLISSKSCAEDRPALDDSSSIRADEKDSGMLANGCVQNLVMPSERPSTISSNSDQELQPRTSDAFNKQGIYISQYGGPFHQAQKDVSSMVLHLKKMGQICLNPKGNVLVDGTKFNVAKEALINESRQFVTSSKLFVKSAIESSDRMIENMAVGVALLNRMFAVSELVIMHMSSREQVTLLIEKLRDVAIAYLRTVDAAHKAVITSNPYMGLLMSQATTLATTLTSLMRTLRDITYT